MGCSSSIPIELNATNPLPFKSKQSRDNTILCDLIKIISKSPQKALDLINHNKVSIDDIQNVSFLGFNLLFHINILILICNEDQIIIYNKLKETIIKKVPDIINSRTNDDIVISTFFSKYDNYNCDHHECHFISYDINNNQVKNLSEIDNNNKLHIEICGIKCCNEPNIKKFINISKDTLYNDFLIKMAAYFKNFDIIR